MDISVFKKLADDADRQLKTMNTQLPKESENLLLLESNLHLEKLLEEMTKRAEKAERERDAAFILCGKLIALCSPPKEWKPKLFRRHVNRPGDYMGCGYDFLDSFNRIFDNFAETADEGLYAAIREAAEKEILERTQRMISQKEE